MNNFEQTRQRFKPTKVNLLYIGESPPKSGNFLYFANSILYTAIQEAFEKVFPDIGKGRDFLYNFKKLGCFLDDLCHEPINHLPGLIRLQTRKGNIEQLASRIIHYKPKAIVVLMKGIQLETSEAI